MFLKNKTRRCLVFVPGLMLMLVVSPALAHTPYMSCFKSAESVCCYSEFSDGSSTAGTPVRVTDGKDNVLLEGRMDSAGEYCFAPPAAPYTVIFDAGPGHVTSETSATIF